MIPSTWRPHFRGSDGELVGYLDGADPAVTPRTLFGYPVGGPGPLEWSIMIAIALAGGIAFWLKTRH